mgnify:CR=1 FL=1
MAVGAAGAAAVTVKVGVAAAQGSRGVNQKTAGSHEPAVFLCLIRRDDTAD